MTSTQRRSDTSGCNVTTATTNPQATTVPTAELPRLPVSLIQPSSWPISQDTLRKWERSARESSFICNQVDSFSCCLIRVQGNIAAHLKVIRDNKAKGKSSLKPQEATKELNHLMNFNESITFAMARTMQDL